MIDYKNVLRFYKGKRVFITGNTGFKGSWLTYILIKAGAHVTGYSLNPPTNPNLYSIMGIEGSGNLMQYYGDVRKLNELCSTIKKSEPEIVFHLAAQPIVRDSYEHPVETYDVNVMGTVNLCESIRLARGVHSFLNVTTDKVYKNVEWEYGYREIDELDGVDPYSNSKSCSELVTHSYAESFFRNQGIATSTVRAGNVIGGGDFSKDRIIPDCVRALSLDGIVSVRNPKSIRPYEHVLEPIFAYLLIAKEQYEDISIASSYNIGPNDDGCVSTGELVSLFCKGWNEKQTDIRLNWVSSEEYDAPLEANFLKLDCSKLKNTFGWSPRWNIYDAVCSTVRWTDIWMKEGNILKEMDSEIESFINLQ